MANDMTGPEELSMMGRGEGGVGSKAGLPEPGHRGKVKQAMSKVAQLGKSVTRTNLLLASTTLGT